MPLLKKKSFEKRPLPDVLRDDEEVFYCEITNEIFRDYDEFAERMLLCNSMVWTCSMTGKSNLTYSEALENELNAKKSLKEFAPELRIPILYLASITTRTSFGDMAEDIIMYVKDRYFVGENLEILSGNKWKESHIIQVIAPTEEQIKINKSESNNLGPSPNLYKYEVEYLHDDDKDSSEMLIVDPSQMRRKKTVFNKEKCKLFLKQYVQQDSNGVFRIKQSVLDEFSINKLKFSQIFDGPPPVFDTSKRIKDKDNSKTVNGKKNVKQETMAKYLTKDGKKGGENGIKEKKTNDLMEQMKKREEEFKLKKQQKEEERLALKQKKKEDNLKVAQLLKEWYKPKEDLQLEDQMKLPTPIPIKLKIPDKYVGDMLMILEFVNSFSKLLQTKSFFPNGFTLETAEKVLTENHVAGPLIDLIQMLLSALFIVQERESNEYRTEIEQPTDKKGDDNLSSENINLHEGSRLATLASTWSSKYQGLPLGRLPLYSLTVSEVLRLHLLSSGARINEVGAKWRYAQRGGYTSEDDPGLYFRLHHADILKALAVHNVVQLSMGDKIKVINCLIDQLLTYADVRDVIEERLDKSRQCKLDHKIAQTADRKREQEYGTAKLKIKKENKDDANAMNAALDKLQIDNDRKKVDSERAMAKIMKGIGAFQIDFGYDRAYRKYYKLESVPGLFVNHEEENPGVCLSETVKQIPDLANANRDQTIEYIRKNLDEINSSDKENEPKSSSPSKKVNGVRKSIQQDNYCDDLLICSANPATCIVHNVSTPKRVKWSFVEDDAQLSDFINNLNKRGIREGELLQMLKMDKESLEKIISQTPVSLLNPDCIDADKDGENAKLRLKKPVKDKNSDDSNLGYPMDMDPEEVLHNALIDNILEMEEKIFAGNLGKLSVSNRDEWRNCLLHHNYADLDRTIVKKPQIKIKSEKLEKSRSNTPEICDFKPDLAVYHDPGCHLAIKESDSAESGESIDSSSNGMDLEQSTEMSEAIEALSTALCQVAYAVEPKYLKKPLGRADLGKNDKKKEVFDVLDRWAQSLISSTSFSQIFLHYGNLDSCVMWSRSVLRARCRTCRRQNDSENMLLCDSCNLGHHLYCLKPKLTAVPEGEWFCDKCQREKEKQELLLSPEPRKKRRIFRVEEEEEEEEESANEEEESDEDYCSDADMSPKVELCKVCSSGGDELICCEKCSNSYHLECAKPPLRRAPRGSWLCYSCKNTNESEDSEEEFVCHKKNRRDEARNDLPLHNVALQEVLADVMKHPDAWPFLRPVQKNEVPDYYDVITKPMDFGTIKYKLNMGEYNEDYLLMKDVILVFENCNTYNHTEAEVYKCGVRLLKYFQKKCKALNLRVPEELEIDEENAEPKAKKARLK